MNETQFYQRSQSELYGPTSGTLRISYIFWYFGTKATGKGSGRVTEHPEVPTWTLDRKCPLRFKSPDCKIPYNSENGSDVSLWFLLEFD